MNYSPEDWEKQSDDGDMLSGCVGTIGYAIVFWLVILLCVLCAGCKSVRYVSVPTVHTDTLIITKAQRDSIWLHDSIHVTEKQMGDTIFIMHDRWRSKYKEIVSHDTLYMATHDTVTVVTPSQPTKQPLTKWQKLRMKMGDVMILFISCAIVFCLIKLMRLFMP